MSPFFYEDFEIGDEYRPPGRTVTESDIVAFAGLSGDLNPLHTDAVFAQTSRFGRRIAHGLLGLSMAGGFLSRAGVIDGTAIAFLAVEWKFTAPVFTGDTIRGEIRVARKRETSNRGAGIVEFDFQMINECEQVVQKGTHTFLVASRGPT